MQRECVILLLVCLLVSPSTTASAQTLTGSSLSTMASRLMRGVGRDGSARVALLPIGDAGTGADASVLTTLTSQLQGALGAAIAAARSTTTLVPAAEASRAVAELGLPQPVGPAGAELAGHLLGVDWVVVGWLETRGSGARLSAQVVEVSSRRRVATADADIALPASLRTAAPQSAPPVLSPARSSWKTRNLTLLAGFGAAAAAAIIAMSKEDEVRRAKERLEAVPPGATQQFNTEIRLARQAERTRNFWWGAAAGVGGVTLAYMLVSDSPKQRPQTSPGVFIPLPGKWLVEAHPASRRVWIGRVF